MKKILIIGLMIILSSGSLLAQRQNRGMGKPHDRHFAEQFGDKMFERGRRYEMLRVKKMLEFLELDEQTEEKLLPVFIEDRRNHRKLQNERIDIIKRLADQIQKDELNEKRVNKLFEKLEENEQNQLKIRSQFLAQVRSFLSTKQLAKMIVFEERFNQRLFGKMRQMGMDRREHNQFKDEEL